MTDQIAGVVMTLAGIAFAMHLARVFTADLFPVEEVEADPREAAVDLATTTPWREVA